MKDEKTEESEMLKEVVASQVDGILYMNDEINESQYAMLNVIQDEYKVPIVLANTLVSLRQQTRHRLHRLLQGRAMKSPIV
ncbi:MAG: hypothetical protein MZU97_17490 [Bacillus subtilis]|nr:hypothetical protein [Bacillus subtilis]